MSPFNICANCPHLDRTTLGSPPCVFDPTKPVSVRDRVASGICPAGYFSGKPLPAAVFETRPGDLVKTILETLGFQHTPNGVICPNGTKLENCGCCEMQRRMNQLGYLGCLRNRRELVEWFTARARDCGVDVGRGTVLSLLWAGLKQWRQKSTS